MLVISAHAADFVWRAGGRRGGAGRVARRPGEGALPDLRRAMGFGVWSAAVSAQGTVKETPGSVNLPISIGGQIVRPGDAIIADDDALSWPPRRTAGRSAPGPSSPSGCT